tara:strand:+ start:1124 stop:1954 length:831 start_codon:yes stop_codon:yes gene_type:complete
MKIIDSFIFYNEFDLLNYRLSILNDFVDYFILVESTHTFTGHQKKLFYNENKKIFDKFNHKIIHIIVDNIPYKYPNINYQQNDQWQNEYFQRNCISKGINQIKDILIDEDIILTSDVDEIPDPKILFKVKNNKLIFDKNNLNKLSLDMYYYNLNLRLGDGQNWHGIKLITWYSYNKINLSFQQMRIWEHSHNVPIIPYGGWHLSYFGDINFIINKIKGFSHQEYNNNKYINKEILEKKIKNGINFIGGLKLQKIKVKDNTNLPPQYEIYLKDYYIE